MGNNDGAITARHYKTGRWITVEWRDGVICRIDDASHEAEADLWVAPPLFDPQVNGYAGVDFQQDGLTEEMLLRAVRQLREAGCGRFFLTLITDEWSSLIGRIEHLRALRATSPELQAAIAGWHIEGPFLSQEPGFHGAHSPALMRDPTPDLIRNLRAATGSERVLLTLAPERKGALEAIALAKSLGISISLGHTNASAETLLKAVEAGATGFTHLGNACPKELDRHDNILWRVFETPGLIAGMIPDKIHVSPPLFRLAHKTLGAQSIYYTTDAMAAAGAPPGTYTIGSLSLEVGADQVVRQPGKTNFAGSALRPIDGVQRAAEMLDCNWQEVWDGFSTRAETWLGVPSRLAVGQPAEFCLINTGADGQIQKLNVRTAL